MIFVTYGTQPHDFPYLTALVNLIDVKHEVVVQIGSSVNNITRPNTQVFDFADNYMDYVKQADIIITHSGVGSIITGLLLDKKVICVSRLAQFGEHIDDHQLEVANKLSNQNFVYHLKREEDINNVISLVETKHFNKYKSNNQNFVDSLKKLIEEKYDTSNI